MEDLGVLGDVRRPERHDVTLADAARQARGEAADPMAQLAERDATAGQGIDQRGTLAEAVRTGNFLTAEESAENIWNSIPDDCIAKPVLLFGEAVGVTT